MENESLPSKAFDLLKDETAPLAKTAAKLADEALSPTTQSFGKTLSDIWYLVFGGIGYTADKRRLKYANELKIFESELEKQLSEIPDEKRTEPSVQTAMNALSDARYCVEEPELREMFCKLLASACNSDTATKAHPSFASIIRRMSPFDASLLCDLSHEKILNHPIAKYVIKNQNGNTRILMKNVLCINGSVLENMKEVALSLDILHSLGLIDINYMEWISDNSPYAPFETSAYYLNLCKTVAKRYGEQWKAESERGVLTITDLGQQFISVCL